MLCHVLNNIFFASITAVTNTNISYAYLTRSPLIEIKKTQKGVKLLKIAKPTVVIHFLVMMFLALLIQVGCSRWWGRKVLLVLKAVKKAARE